MSPSQPSGSSPSRWASVSWCRPSWPTCCHNVSASSPRLRRQRPTLMSDITLSELERLEAIANETDVALAMDEDAFRAFYDRTCTALWGYLSRISGDRQLADDLLQEAYYRLLRAGERFESEAHRRNYLYRIATNLVRDSRRKIRPLRDEDVELASLPADQARYCRPGSSRRRAACAAKVATARAGSSLARLCPRIDPWRDRASARPQDRQREAAAVQGAPSHGRAA